jgi:hypothetical protein
VIWLVLVPASVFCIFALQDKGLVFSRGDSMKPAYGDVNVLVVSKPHSIEDLHVGDVIGFSYVGQNTCHRITDIFGDGSIWVWGDNTAVCLNGQMVRFSQVDFVVVESYRLTGVSLKPNS